MIFNIKKLSEFKENLRVQFADTYGTYRPENVYIKEYKIDAPLEGQSRELWVYKNIDPHKVELSRVYWENTKKPKYETVFTEKLINRFEVLNEESLNLIFRIQDLRELFKILVNDIFPVELLDHATPPKPIGRGFSTHGMPGAVFIKAPALDNGIVENHALNIVHEMGHQALMLVQWHDQIFISGATDPIYSVIRKIHRPAIKSMHALVATSFMAKYLKDLKSKNFEIGVLSDTYKSLLISQKLGLEVMKNLNYTEIGQEIYNDCLNLIEKIE